MKRLTVVWLVLTFASFGFVNPPSARAQHPGVQPELDLSSGFGAWT